MANDGGKICKGCGVKKPLHAFQKYSRYCERCSPVKTSNGPYKVRKRHWKDWLHLKHDIRCIVCDFDACFDAIDCHHVKTKSFDIANFIGSQAFTPQNIVELEKELEGCVFLCATCHRMLHAGFFCLL